jgi:bifunctional non-homologous end joining protein LigD
VPKRKADLDIPQGAVRASLPPTLEPQLATLVTKPPTHGDWLYEIKFDGYRMLARIDSRGQARMLTRRGNDWTARFPALVAELESLQLPPGWYDGEIVVLKADGTPDFNRLQNAIESRENAQIVFYLFDAPFLGGLDLRKVAVEDRRALLQRTFTDSTLVRFSKELPHADAADLLASACKMGLEGIVAKRRGSFYVHRRSDEWLKLKCTQREEFVIGGYTWPDESRSDAGIGALLVGQFDEQGRLQYAGKVGTGFTGEMSAQLRARLDAISQPRRPFAGSTGHDRHATWVRPELVCEVAYGERPEAGSLRHASFKGLREDKPAGAVSREVAAPAPLPVRKITNAARVIDPSTGLTKGDLARYYAEVAQWMLPYLAGRPVYVARFPQGIEGERIFQQHPLGMKGFKGTDPKLWPGHEPAISIETAEDLVLAAQFDAIEIHTWNSTAKAIAQPDRVVFDLDPGAGVTWAQVREAALLVHALLEELGLRSWVKTTGGKALHLFVPVQPGLDHASARDFAERVVRHLERTLPDRFVSKSGMRNRVGRIFIDWLRNGQSQSTAETFSARARPGMGVSMPIAWDELPEVDGGAHWNITTAVERLRRLKKDPWAGYWKSKQSLVKAVRAFS